MKSETVNRKVLIVDDDPEMRIFLSTVLATGGFIPIVAENGREAVNKALVESPILIILDIMMCSKENLYINIRQDKRFQDIPVIMLSALSRNTVFHFQKYQSSIFGYRVPEPEAYIEKPPEAEDLLNIVNKLISHLVNPSKS